MRFIDKIFGRPLPSSAEKDEKLSVWTGVPSLGLDSFASTAYGPEAALLILAPLGIVGLHYYFYISLAIIFTLFSLYLSYQQTAGAYPLGGGAYIVASDNLGRRAGIWAAVALMMDYLLNVAVGISAGVGAIVSAMPALHSYILVLCLIILFMLTILNLRGVREAGVAFIIPTIAFVFFMGIAIVIAFFEVAKTGGHPVPVVSPAPLPPSTTTVSMWLLLGAFANGLTAMTGVEAVSNAIPLFRQPVVTHARWTLTIIISILGLMLLAFAFLFPEYHLIGMDESKPGYQTVLSQLVAAATGKGIFYYCSIVSIFIILTYSAQTSFMGFPRVCRLLAEDDYLPHFFGERGRRLVFSYGIIVLAVLSALLLIGFKGITMALIPLFAVGAFSAFLFSQVGMMVHWIRKRGPYFRIKLFFNSLGATVTFIALCIIVAAKFLQGAWLIFIIAPLFVLLFSKIRRHYKKIARLIKAPLKLHTSDLQQPVVIIPIRNWDLIAEKAVRFGLLLSSNVTAVYISTDQDNKDGDALKKIWAEKVERPAKRKRFAKPMLEVINSPYRRIYKPILDFVNRAKKDNPNKIIAVIIPVLVEAHWYEALLHNIHAAGLRTLLFLKRDQRTVVITTPWYLGRKK